jgi:transcriptional regulator with XRE-family HTH domain
MIKNDRQYRLSKAQIREFSDAIAELKNQPTPPGIDPAFGDVQFDALKSQLDELSADVQEYEALKSGSITQFEAHSLDELPILLVKARIARGMTHKELAELLQVKEQQVQRWESNDFAGASLDNLKAIASALGVVFTQRLFLPRQDISPAKFLSFIDSVGLQRDFILRRVLPETLADSFRAGTATMKEVATFASTVARVFGLRMAELVELKVPRLDFTIVATTRFKLPARHNAKAVNGYTIYAHYLAGLVVSCVNSDATQTLPKCPREFYHAVTGPETPLSFERVVRFLWDCGVVVLPLSDAGVFHGAVWKISDRFVIVVKQTTPLESRWLYDALHEVGHIGNGDVNDTSSFIEDEEISPQSSNKEEEAANEWAENAIFDGKSDDIEEAATDACKEQLRRLKAVLPSVAARFNVNLGCLANHMAYRLGEQGEDWWGAAQNLQSGGRLPFETARSVLLENVNLFCLNDFDRELLQRALREE